MVDYSKYSNMDAKQLINSLMALERKEKKYRAQSQAKIKDMQELAHFLKSKIKENLDSPKFVRYVDSQSYKIAREREAKRTQSEQKTLAKEVNDLIYKDYGDEL